MIKLGYIKAYGVNYSGTLPKIKKSENKFQPLFEALTNSFEAIKLLGNTRKKAKITIRTYFSKNLFSDDENEFNFKKFLIEDNGIGFNNLEFERLISLNDNRKGFSNKGTGRVQYVHFFDKTSVSSIYKDKTSSTGYRERKFELSKKKPFLDKNSIINYISNDEIKAQKIQTIVSLNTPLSDKDLSFYNNVDLILLKTEILNQYLVYFCENRDSLPKLSLEVWIDGKLKDEHLITSKDIPKEDYETNFNVPYSQTSNAGKAILKTNEYESFNLKSFVIERDSLDKNELILTSKGQLAKKIKLTNLSPEDQINNKRYLFLISGEYIDKRDSDTRGKIQIPSKADFKKDAGTLFNDKEIVIE